MVPTSELCCIHLECPSSVLVPPHAHCLKPASSLRGAHSPPALADFPSSPQPAGWLLQGTWQTLCQCAACPHGSPRQCLAWGRSTTRGLWTPRSSLQDPSDFGETPLYFIPSSQEPDRWISPSSASTWWLMALHSEWLTGRLPELSCHVTWDVQAESHPCPVP